MQAENERRLQELNAKYQEELQTKQDLEKKLQQVQSSLLDIETTFPQELQQIRDKVQQAKATTVEYEQKTEKLVKELNELKARAAGLAQQKEKALEQQAA